MQTTPPPNGEPHARGSVLHGFRAAVVDLWGEEGLRDLADRLPADVRAATFDAIVLPFEWVPVAHTIAWHEALAAGPARGDDRELARAVGRAIDLGFGRFKSAFFSGVTPERLVERAPELWRWQHTHGQLSAHAETATGLVTLQGHPYVDHPVSRRVTAESFRHIVTIVLGPDSPVRVTATISLPSDRVGAAPPTHKPDVGATPSTRSQRTALHVRLSWRA